MDNSPAHGRDFTRSRSNYQLNPPLHSHDVSNGWFPVFSQWIQDATDADICEPHAIVLATATADGIPSTRTVLAKKITEEFLEFFTNSQSRKGQQLKTNPNASATFFWREHQRQVHMAGHVEQLSPQESDTYWQLRPRDSQISAWSSQQSEPIACREDMEKNWQQMDDKWTSAESVPRPKWWGGYRLHIQRVELWQGGENRYHDRFEVLSAAQGGKIQRLQP